MSLMIKCAGRYRVASKDEILAAAIQYAVNDAPRAAGHSPQAILRAARGFIAARDTEAFYASALDARMRVIGFSELFRGTVDASAVYPREVVKWALQQNAVHLVICHNHPSGALEASAADRSITERIKSALALVDIRLVDHVIIAGDGDYSFAAHGLI